MIDTDAHTHTHSPPSQAALRAARAIKHYEGICNAYGYTLSVTATAAIIERETHAGTINVTPPVETGPVTVVYASTVALHRQAVTLCALRHQAGALGAGSRLLALA